MTEQEWWACDGPEPMLYFLQTRGPLSGRKIRLFAAALCRRAWPLLTRGRYRRAVEEAERFAEGESGPDRLRAALGDEADSFDWLGGVSDVAFHATRPASDFGAAESLHISRIVASALGAASFPDADFDHDAYLGASDIRTREAELHASLLRCVFGIPLGPLIFPRAGLTPMIDGLAHTVYVERIMPSGELDPDRLAVLSDALEEAGCDDPAILDHLRSPGPHVRGCWALDLILGKE